MNKRYNNTVFQLMNMLVSILIFTFQVSPVIFKPVPLPDSSTLLKSNKSHSTNHLNIIDVDYYKTTNIFFP